MLNSAPDGGLLAVLVGRKLGNLLDAVVGRFVGLVLAAGVGNAVGHALKSWSDGWPLGW